MTPQMSLAAKPILSLDSVPETETTLSRFWVAPSRKLFWHRFLTSSAVTFPTHAHAEYNVVICLNGAVEVRQFGRAYVAEAGEALITNAGIPHESVYTPANKHCEAVSLTLSTDLLERAVSDVYDLSSRNQEQPLFLGKVSSRAIQGIATQVREQLQEGHSCNNEYLYKLGRRLAAEILRAQSRPDSYESHSSAAQTLLPRWQHVKTHELMLRSSKLEFSIPLVAHQLGISPGRFHLLFRSSTGVSPAHYFGELILTKASNLLTSTNSSVKEISYELGFCSPSHFCKAFKKHYGTSPLDFRRMSSNAKKECLKRATSSWTADAGSIAEQSF